MKTLCGTVLVAALAVLVAKAECVSHVGFMRADELGGDCHSPSHRTHDGIPSIAVSDLNGRMWAVWYSSTTGTENSSNYLVLSTSADGGKTWREAVIYDPDGPGPLRAFDSELWIAPDGRLRWTWTEREVTISSLGSPSNDRLMMVELDAEKEPDVAALSALGNLRQIARGIMMCKPIVLKDGTWLLPVARWFEAPSSCIYASSDGGRTFAERGGVTLPAEWRGYDEHNLVELRDGTLRAYIRVRRGPEGLWESESPDGGFTWSAPHPSVQPHVDSRAFVRRLSSGNLLMVKNGLPGERLRERRDMTAYISEDDGKTWPYALTLDPVDHDVAYPDGKQAEDGSIYIIHDFARRAGGYVFMHRITEDDIIAGKLVTPTSWLRRLVGESKPV